jgi:hypothetical protein
MTRAPRNGPTKVHSSIASLHKNGFGLKLFSINLILNVLYGFNNPGLYRLEVDNHLPTSPKIWPQKGPNITQKWQKISKIVA